MSISPGTFKTAMGEIEGEEAAAMAMRGALGRMGEPEEIAEMIAFMTSDKCTSAHASSVSITTHINLTIRIMGISKQIAVYPNNILH